MGKLALKIYKTLYGLDIEAQNIELVRLRLENKRLSELLRSTSREYNSLNDKYKKAKEKNSGDYDLIANELQSYKDKYESLLTEKNALEESHKTDIEKLQNEISNISLTMEKQVREIDDLRNENAATCIERDNLKDELKSLKEHLANTEKKEEVPETEKEDTEAEVETINVISSEYSPAEGVSAAEEEKTIEETEETVICEETSSESIDETEDTVQPEEAETTSGIEIDEESKKEMMQNEIVALTQKFKFIRVTTAIGNQYIYQSKYFQLRTGLFDWGIEGKEIITDDNLYLENQMVSKMEGLESPFDGEEITCDLNDEESANAIAESLLTAICTYQPIQVNYHDKNGRTTLKNLYHVTFKPMENKIRLPYRDLFRDMLEEKIDTEQITAQCPHNNDPRNFAISQILTLRRFNAFFTTPEGIETMKEGIKIAKEAEQTELADLLSCKLQV